MTERELQDQVRLILGSDPACVFHENIIGSGYLIQHPGDEPKRFRKYGYANPGGSDLVGCFRGRFIGVELKSRTGKQRDAQVLFQELIEKKGGLYFIVRSEDDARALLADLHQRFPA